jgi:hypothetical protein
MGTNEHPPTGARSGAALLLVLLLLFLLDCIVLGSVHLAVVERRLAANVDTALRLRLHAESGVRQAAAVWNVAADTLPAGAPPLIMLRDTAPDGTARSATIQKIAEWSYFLRGDAMLPAPHRGRAAAALLLRPPALPPDVEPAAAAFSAHATVRLNPGAQVAADGAAMQVHDMTDIEPFDPGQVDGEVGWITRETDVLAVFDRLATLFDPPAGARSRRFDAGLMLSEDFTGTLLVDGDLRVTAGVTVRGLVVVRGGLVLEADALVLGAVHVGANADVSGSIALDPDAVAEALADAGLLEPRPFRGRAWVPAF